MTEWRTISLRPVEMSAYVLWKQAVRIICNHLGSGGNPHPSPTAIAGCMANAVLQASDLQVSAQYLDDVLEGRAHCWYPLEGGVEFTIPDTGHVIAVCRSYANLERHHSIPRSLGGHDSELIWLCAPHHRAISDGIDNKDWRWLRQALGYDTEGR